MSKDILRLKKKAGRGRCGAEKTKDKTAVKEVFASTHEKIRNTELLTSKEIERIEIIIICEYANYDEKRGKEETKKVAQEESHTCC